MSIPPLENGGEGISVGIADSLYPDPDDVDTLGYRVDYTASKEADPIGHGSVVFDILSHYLENAEFGFYRYIGQREKQNSIFIDDDEPSDRRSGDLLNAFKDAANHDIDVLNVSNGFQIPEYDPLLTEVRELNEAVDRGLTIVSASGNVPNGVTKVAFPAIAEHSIAVSGFVPRCRPNNGDDQFSYWIDLSDVNVSRSDRQGPFCGYEPGSSGTCTHDRCELVEEEWRGNVRPVKELDKPDVFAPAVYPHLTPDGSFVFKEGTSFSCPIVTALIVRVLSAIDGRRSPSAEVVRRSIRESGTRLSTTEGVKPQGDSMMRTLLST